MRRRRRRRRRRGNSLKSVPCPQAGSTRKPGTCQAPISETKHEGQRTQRNQSPLGPQEVQTDVALTGAHVPEQTKDTEHSSSLQDTQPSLQSRPDVGVQATPLFGRVFRALRHCRQLLSNLCFGCRLGFWSSGCRFGFWSSNRIAP